MKQFSHNTKMKFIAGSNLLPIETNETFHIHSFSTSQVDFIFLKENADIKDDLKQLEAHLAKFFSAV